MEQASEETSEETSKETMVMRCRRADPCATLLRPKPDIKPKHRNGKHRDTRLEIIKKLLLIMVPIS